MPRGGMSRRGGGVKRPARPPKNTASKRAKTEAPLISATSAYTRYVESSKKLVDDEKTPILTKSIDGVAPDTVNSKGAPSYTSTGNPCLNLFYSAFVRGTPTERVHELMSLAWQHEAETCLKILLHARDCRAGKGEKKVALDAMIWLRQHKPATYLLMLESYLDVAYLKDLLMLTLAAQTSKLPSLSSTTPSDPISTTCEPIEMEIFAEFLKRDHQALTQYIRWGHKVDKKREQDVMRILLKKHKRGDKKKEEKEDVTCTPAPAVQDEKTNDSAGINVSSDEPEIISVVNGEAMEDEVDVKADGGAEAKKPKDDRIHIPHLSLSLAGKWTPTEGSSFDKQAKLAKRMARLLFPTSARCFQEYRQMCSKLRQHLNIVERHMCLQQWNMIQFGHVPSKAHNLLKRAFAKHEQERYTAYIQRVKTGHEKINVGTVHPHEILSPYIQGTSWLNETTEVQWKAMIDDLKKAQSESKEAGVGEDVFGRALAIVDVSGSMTGLPMHVAVSLGLIVQELTNPPFRGRLITFDKNPTWHQVKGDSLYERVRDVMEMPWGMTTDLLKVFRLILGTAKEFSVPASAMPDTLFIFSDMQFDAAAGSDFLGTTHQHIQKMYGDAGYVMPRIVFWNLNGAYSDVPVKELTPGVAAISGFSAQLLKLFMSCKNFSPYHIMLQAVDKYVVKIHEAER